MKYIKLSQYAKEKGVHYNSAYNHFNNGKIEGAYKEEEEDALSLF